MHKGPAHWCNVVFFSFFFHFFLFSTCSVIGDYDVLSATSESMICQHGRINHGFLS